MLNLFDKIGVATLYVLGFMSRRDVIRFLQFKEEQDADEVIQRGQALQPPE